MPAIPFREEVNLGEVPQTEKYIAFGLEDLERDCREGVYEKVEEGEVRALLREGKMVPSAFFVWQGEVGEERGTMVINFHQQSKHWPNGSVRMETVQGFATEVQFGHTLMSWDVKNG